MNGRIRKALLCLVLVALIVPAVGCDLRRGGSSYGNPWSYTDVFLGFDYVPTFTDYVYDEFEYYEEEYTIVEDTYYYEDEYWDDGYYWDDTCWDCW
jgi:hypothetical protein